MTLGERIKKYRRMEGLSQDLLAEKLNVSRQAITKWENDNGVPDIDNLIALSKLMGISLDELVMGENEESFSVIKKEVTNQRNENSATCLISVIGFSVAVFCWVISFILNIANGNDFLAILNAICIGLLIVPITKNLKKYFEIKEQ